MAVHLRNNSACNKVDIMQMRKGRKMQKISKKVKLRGQHVKEWEQRSWVMVVCVLVPFPEMGNRRGARPGHVGGEEHLGHTRADVK